MHADLLTGEGLTEALEGVEIVVHAATDGRKDVAVDKTLIEAPQNRPRSGHS